MDRRSSSILLIPLVAALALFYPAGSRTKSAVSAGLASPHPSAKETASGKRKEGWRGGRLAVQHFFGFSDETKDFSWANKGMDPRANASVQFLVATLPDPIDSGLPYSYDRNLAAIEGAVQRQGYVLADFDLPWEDCSPTANRESGQGATRITIDASSPRGISLTGESGGCPRRFADEPGFLLFYKSTGAAADFLVIYLIGETPTAGIQKRAFANALGEISVLCGWKPEPSDFFSGAVWPKPACKESKEVRILAPSFTGSAQSLDLALSLWIDSLPDPKPALKVTMISGSATGIVPPAESTAADTSAEKKGDFSNTQLRLGKEFQFRSMENPDQITLPAFLNFLSSQHGPGHAPIRIALLLEQGTTYGERAITEKLKENPVQITQLAYPLHISQLRAESSKVRQAAQEASQQAAVPGKNLALDEALEDKGKRKDIESMSSATSVSSEQVMANILSAISREGDNYVGIFASDVRDVMFLAREVHEHSPKVVLFTFTADLLYLHPEINQSLRGMLVVNSYPMNNSNQLWSLPSNPGVRIQFPDDASESTYNAAMALLNHDALMMDYSLPFPGDQSPPGTLHPPIWISVVGRDRLWPVLAQAPGDRHYTYEPLKNANTMESSRWWRGIYPENSLIFIFVFIALSCIFCVLLMRSTQESNRTRLDAALAPPVSGKYRPQAELLLLVSCTSLAAFLIVALTVLGIPAGRIIGQGHLLDVKIFAGGQILTGIVLGVGCIYIVVLLPRAIASLFRSVKKEFAREFVGAPGKLSSAVWIPMVGGSAIVLIFALVFSASWIWKALVGDFRGALFTGIRYLDLTNGVSALVPLLLVSVAGFLWSTSSFHRIRMLEGMCHSGSFLFFSAVRFRCIRALENKIERVLQRPSLHLRGSFVVLILAIASIVYLFVLELVPSFESYWFYILLASAYLFVSLALWLGVLRFYLVWDQMHHMLQQLALTPMRDASKRFRRDFPTWPKIDLAMPAPSLAPLALSLDMLHTAIRHAHQVAAKKTPVANDNADKKQLEKAALSDSEQAALDVLTSPELARRVEAAQESLAAAQDADAARSDDAGQWRLVLKYQCQTHGFLADVTAMVSQALEMDWWKELRSAKRDPDKTPSEVEMVFERCEEFLAGRVAHFFAHLFPQMQNLIYTSVAGLLLMLFAISSYPFQPHNQLLLFNWIVVLSFVGTAMWVFVQMSRDPILSNLNGTKPGEITWDREFVLRLFLYGVVPILALLGAQFPDTVGQVLSHIAPAESMHP